MSTLLEKMRKARESVIETGGHRYTIRRPTDLQIVEMEARDGGLSLRNALGFVIGWDLEEIDLVPGGTTERVPFDPELFMEWISDKPADWGNIMQALRSAYRKHEEQMEQAKGN